VFCLAFKLFCG